ncbi:MAG: phospholipase D family protein [Candidatus Hydrogenedentota bacterium]
MRNIFHPLFPILLTIILTTSTTATQASTPSALLDLATTITESNQRNPQSPRHQALVLDDGFESFVLRVHLVRSAKHTIDIQTFIWADEETSRYFAQELIKASQRGVKIRLLVDHMWSTKNPERLAWNAQHLDGIQIKLYRPTAKRLKLSFPRKLINFLTPNGTNQRMHNKVMVVDNTIGITGGRNIGNNYFDYATKYNFKDREVLIIGPAVADMTRSFQAYWDFKRSYASTELLDVAEVMENGALEPPPSTDNYDLPYFQSLNTLSDDPQYIQNKFVIPSTPVQNAEFIADKPGRKTFSYFFSPHGGGAMAHTMRRHFLEAEDRVLIQSPYIILNRRTRRVMKKAKRYAPDLQVKVSTNSFGAADHLETYSANYRLRTKVIRGLGFQIYEFKPHPEDLDLYLDNFDDLKARAEEQKRAPYLSIHAKTYTFDDHTTFIGTYNLDPRSFYINGECGVFIHDQDFTQNMAQRLLNDMAPENSWVIARKQRALTSINRHIEGISSWLPIDLWPLRYTSSFELKTGYKPVPPDHPEFYQRYRDLGNFPGSQDQSSDEIITKMYKRFGKAATPLL